MPFDCSRAPLNDEDALISLSCPRTPRSTRSPDFVRSGASGDERDAVWCATQGRVRCTSSSRRERQETRRRAPGALENARDARGDDQYLAPPPPLQNSSPASTFSSADSREVGVAPGELGSRGTQAGVVGVFLLVQGPSHAEARPISSPSPHRSPSYVTAIVTPRCVAWDANARRSCRTSQHRPAGEDVSPVRWTPGTNDDAALRSPVDRTRPPGRRHSPY